MIRVTRLDTEKIGPVLWKLNRPLLYATKSGMMHIPKGFVTDGASCPQILWAFCSPMSGNQAEAAVLHDYLYSRDSGTGLSRKEADQMFKNSMLNEGVSPLKSAIIYSGVRIGGKKSWKVKFSKDKVK